ncbi:tripartite tricarboxylate transporter substrate binding protein [uncultured Aliiroseovarius sp.]|uniref:Bug family tripartite tricarboxylate transporter substrate binding protein n=1 Tax=uncultured Aliiroseovarius sp. TaxID=1658783 RepID=UPI002596CBD6|nr:tripartite tricarboxylate transporter substrate binding protein [uncultured Aliiroseovarius sp.]
MKNPFINRRGVLQLGAGGLAFGAGLSALPGLAQDKFPSNPIDIVVPFGVGGGTDIWLRAMSIGLSSKKGLGVPVNVRNVPGAGSLRGAGEGFTADPDGYTLTGFNPPSTPWAWYLSRPPFDITQFRGVSVYVREPGIIVAHPDAGIDTFEQMIEAYNSGAKKIIASQQKGTIWHIAAMLMKQRSDINWEQYVSYKGTSDIIAAILRREVEVGIVTASSAQDAVRDGKLKPLAIVGLNERLESYPDTPTMNEAGKDPLEVCVLRRSVYAPPGIDEERRVILEKATIAAQDDTFMQAQYSSLSLEPARGTGAEADRAIADALAVAEEIDLKSIAT